MKRDMELIRQIACLIEKAPGELHSGSIRIDGFTGPQIDYHCGLMAEWNLIKLIYFTSLRTENGEYARLQDTLHQDRLFDGLFTDRLQHVTHSSPRATRFQSAPMSGRSIVPECLKSSPWIWFCRTVGGFSQSARPRSMGDQIAAAKQLAGSFSGLGPELLQNCISGDLTEEQQQVPGPMRDVTGKCGPNRIMSG